MPIRRSKRSSVERALAAKAKNGDSICYPHHIFAQTDKGGHGYVRYRPGFILNGVKDLTNAD